LVNWYLGTVGFSYKDWDGVFYPQGASPRSYLAHYSQIFNAVEIDSTFYGSPPIERVRQWAATVPEGFKFCPKTPRQITHDARLVNVLEAMQAFINSVRAFEEKLGAILIQLPPNFTAAEFETLRVFLETLPTDLQFAIEFRHQSWFTFETVSLLQSYQVCWTSTAYADLPKQIALTTSFHYIRWLGRHGQFEQKNRIQVDVEPQLEWWLSNIQPNIDRVHAIYGFFNNDFSGYSPATCNSFKELVGLSTVQPQVPQQGKLF
jgi:uncharacterized protein YecE (DUF72 family)